MNELDKILKKLFLSDGSISDRDTAKSALIQYFKDLLPESKGMPIFPPDSEREKIYIFAEAKGWNACREAMEQSLKERRKVR